MVFSKITNLILFPIYHLIHRNILFGYIHKTLIKNFYYKKFKFHLNEKFIPLKNYSSFLFKTYEYNDRALIERNLNNKNKCIIIGGGIGFIATIAYNITKKKIIVFEINNNIIPTLKKNLKLNNCNYKIYSKNLSLKNIKKNKNFFISNDFLDTSSWKKTNKKISVKNISYNLVDRGRKFNTLIIDAEGDEEYYIKSLKNLKNIKHLFFELHYNIFNENEIKNIMEILRKNNFVRKDKCFNSFYFVRKSLK